MISVMPRAFATGVSRCPCPGNLKFDIFDPTSGNLSSSLENVCEETVADVPVITLITSRTLTLGGVSGVLRMRPRDACVISFKTSVMATRILQRD